MVRDRIARIFYDVKVTRRYGYDYPIRRLRVVWRLARLTAVIALVLSIIVGLCQLGIAADRHECADIAENLDREWEHNWTAAGCYIANSDGVLVPAAMLREEVG